MFSVGIRFLLIRSVVPAVIVAASLASGWYHSRQSELPLRESAVVYAPTSTGGFDLSSVCAPSSETEQLQAFVDQAAEAHNLDAELVVAVMATESRCRVAARSHRGARGLMQLMPATAQWLGVNNPLSPEENINAGAKYLRYLLQQFGGDLELALAAYNAGPATVRRYRGIPPYRETRQYVQKVLKRYHSLRVGVSTAEV